jgi:hypothetical protein
MAVVSLEQFASLDKGLQIIRDGEQSYVPTSDPRWGVSTWELQHSGRLTNIVPEPRLTRIRIDLQLQAAIDDLRFLMTFDG